jgi:hypothetical protein
MNLVAIAGVPPYGDMSGKLVGVGGCGCSGAMGDAPTEPSPETQQLAHRMALGLLGVALVLGYFVLRDPVRSR